MAIKKRGGFEGPPPEGSDRGKETNPAEAAPVSEKFLVELYSSPRFLSALRNTRKKMEKHGGEFGFGIVKELGSDTVHFTRIVSSLVSLEEADSVPLGEAVEGLEEKLKKTSPGRKFATLGTLHFHPGVEDDPVIAPSTTKGDLEGSSARRKVSKETGYDFPAVEMIAVMTTDGETKVFVYQEPLGHSPFSYRLPHIAAEMRESFYEEEIENQEEVLALLRHYQYKVAVVRTTGGAFDEEALKTLSGFSFNPRKIEE